MTVADLLTDESQWCKSVARDGERRCLLRAIYDCYEPKEAREIEMRLRHQIYGPKLKLGACLSVWQDSRTFSEVRALVLKARV